VITDEELVTSGVASPPHPTPYTLGEFQARNRWVLPLLVGAFLLLAIGAAINSLPWDAALTRAAVGLRTPTTDAVFLRISWLGSTPVVLTVAGVAALAAWRRCHRLAIAIVVIALARPLVEFGLKELISRPRPDGDRLVAGTGYSFPSGHPLAAAASWCLVPLVVGLYTARRALWWASAVAVWALALAVAASRVWLGVHWTSDVVGGLLLAVLGVWAAERVIEQVHGPACALSRPPPGQLSP
jgi:membrane-associated phospholipid phosphatase